MERPQATNLRRDGPLPSKTKSSPSKGLYRTAELQELIDVAESSDHVNSDREDMGKDLYIYCSIFKL